LIELAEMRRPNAMLLLSDTLAAFVNVDPGYDAEASLLE
jgi:hypothetical protein